jgi:hypothetical protein
LERSDEHVVKRRAMRGRGQWGRPIQSLARYALSPFLRRWVGGCGWQRGRRARE